MSPRLDLGREPASLGYVEVVGCTEKAIRVESERRKGGYGNEKFWVPRSVIHEDSDIERDAIEEDEGELFVHQWWADFHQWWADQEGR